MELLVMNTNFESVFIADDFKSLLWVDRYDEFGDFEFRRSMNSTILNYLQKDFYLWTKESDHCMIIEDVYVDTDIEEGNILTVTGRSLESLLKRRIVWGQKELTGNLQTALQTLFEESIVNPTISERQIPNFIFVPSTDTRITSLTVDTQFTGDELYEVFMKLCKKNNIGFKVILNGSNQFVCSLYCGEDRSYAQNTNPYVVFSPGFENIINSNYFTSKANYKNVTLVAGEGEGASRKTRVVGTASGLNRREVFTDARDVSSDTENGTLSTADYNALLDARGAESLEDYKETTAFEGEVEATKLFKYGEDFFIGDIVQISDDYGNEGGAYISELIISQSEEGISKYPTFKTVQEGGEEE
jgi:hypothetical protein